MWNKVSKMLSNFKVQYAFEKRLAVSKILQVLAEDKNEILGNLAHCQCLYTTLPQ